MRKTSDWDFKGVILFGAQDLVKSGMPQEKAIMVCLSVLHKTITNIFVKKINSAGVAFDMSKYSITAISENSTFVVRYEDKVFEVWKSNEANSALGSGVSGEEFADSGGDAFDFVLVDNTDERWKIYNDRLDTVDTVRRKADEILEQKSAFEKAAHKKPDILN